MVHELDFSTCESPEEAAKLLYDGLCNIGNESEILIESPEEARENGRSSECWIVSWESGPRKWAVKSTGTEQIVSSGGALQLNNFIDASGWIAEPEYSFNLHFTEL